LLSDFFVATYCLLLSITRQGISRKKDGVKTKSGMMVIRYRKNHKQILGLRRARWRCCLIARGSLFDL